MQHARHGDVLLSRTESPQGELIPHDGSYILAYGEATGHHHKISVQDKNNMKVYKTGENLYLCLMEVGVLTHQEHATLEIEPGTYRLSMETEYDPFLSSVRTVID